MHVSYKHIKMKVQRLSKSSKTENLDSASIFHRQQGNNGIFSVTSFGGNLCQTHNHVFVTILHILTH